MPIENIDHIYAETTEWDPSVAFWAGLGWIRVADPDGRIHSLEASP